MCVGPLTHYAMLLWRVLLSVNLRSMGTLAVTREGCPCSARLVPLQPKLSRKAPRSVSS